jgi:two-component system, sensor histidine kinase and response regulator
VQNKTALADTQGTDIIDTHEPRDDEGVGASCADGCTAHYGASASEQVAGGVVLVADDDDINRAVAAALLAKHGLRSEAVDRGGDAVRMALDNDYAAVFMDCEMPGIDGFEAARRIRASEGARRVPIIALTAHSSPGDCERALAAGMDDYLTKPLRLEELEAAIGRWLSAHQEPVALGDAGPLVATSGWQVAVEEDLQ